MKPEPPHPEPIDGEIVAFTSHYVIRLVTGEEVKASWKLPRRLGSVFGPLVGWKVKVVLRKAPRPARIVELLRPADPT